jgi:signal transduction histidine kinase/CheY-like chemotaxis protein
MCLLALVACIPSIAQKRSTLDSLHRALSQSRVDSAKARVLESLALAYKSSQTDSALMYAEQAVLLSNKLPERIQCDMLNTRGIIKKEGGFSDHGVADFSEALQLAKKAGNKKQQSTSLLNLGGAFEILGQNSKAIEYLTQAAEIRLELGQLESVAGIYSNISLAYQNLYMLDKAEEYLIKGLDILGPDHEDNRRIYNNLGRLQVMQKRFSEARKNYRRALRNWKKEEHMREFALVYGNIGHSHLVEGARMDSALHYTLESFEMKKKMGQRSSLSIVSMTIARIYRTLKDYKKAREYGELALEIAEESGSIQFQQDANFVLSTIERDAGNITKAYEKLNRAYILQDSLHGQSVIEASTMAEARFQNSLKEKENELLRLETEVKSQEIIARNRLIAVVGSLGLLLIVGLVLYRRQAIVRRKLLLKVEEQAGKLRELDAAKTRFFANISHDLRTPLSLILGALDNIQTREEKILESASKEELDMGYRNAKRLLYMADEIMDLTRLEEGKLKIQLQQVKVVPYFRLLVKMFHSATDIKNLTLSFTTDLDQEASTTLDPYQFEKVIYNLLSNAIKHTPSGGSIEVSLKQKGQRMLLLSIRDTGTGISPESLPQIFDRFYQSLTNAYQAQEGIGIGLALVKEVVELHKGNIYAESELGKGTTFYIELPFNANEWTSDASVPAPSTQLLSRNSLWTDLLENQSDFQVPGITSMSEGQTILIVEDHKEVRSFLKSMLRNHFRVLTAMNGLEALSLLEREKIDVILTDLMMPLMDGFELIDRLKEDKVFRKIPVIIISARTGLDEKINLIGKGAEDVLSKPFAKEELLARIQNILTRKDWNSQKNLPFTSAQLDELEKELLGKVEALILRRISDPHLSVIDLSNELAASERKTYRMIRRIAGLTPYELIKEVRWQYIYHKLTTEKINTATEAASMIAMANASDFARQFEQRFKKPLREFLNE